MNDSAFPYDVFLSHSAKDKAVARTVAEGLRKDGLRVWPHESAIEPGDSIPAKAKHKKPLVCIIDVCTPLFSTVFHHCEKLTMN